MLKRFYDLIFAVVMFIYRIVQLGDKSVEKFKLQEFEWENIKQIVELLEPLYVATVNLSKSKYPTLSTTLPTYMAMAKVKLIIFSQSLFIY